MNLSQPSNRSSNIQDKTISTPVETRRSFFKWVTWLSSAFIGISLGVPLIGYVISPALKRRESTWTPVGKVEDLPVNEPKDLDYAVTVKDGYLEAKTIKAVWALKHQDGSVTVFSPICPHLGCAYRWDSHDRQFRCPCHGSVFSIDGKVLGGPAPRPLDTLPSKVEDGELYVEWERFELGVPGKIPV